MTAPKKTLILGGGPTGLAAGVRLARAGVPVKVIERLPWTGGLSASFKHGPYTLDLGPHRFTPHNQEVYDFVRGLLDEQMAIVQYRAEILIGKNFLSYPFQLKELLTRLSPTVSLKLNYHYLKALLTHKSSNEVTYEEWSYNNFGSGVTDMVLRPLVEKVWGTPLTGLAARFARQRIATASLWEIVWEVLTHKRPKKFSSTFYPDNCFLYPPSGFGTIMEKMTEEIQKEGGEIETGATVKEVIQEGDRITSVTYEKEGKIFHESPHFVMTTIPIQYFFQILKPAPSPEILEASQKLKTRRLILLYLVLKMDSFSKNTSWYFPSGEFPFGRAWEQKNHSPKTIPVPGKTVLGIEMPCWDSDDLWKAQDKDIFEKAIAPLEKLGKLKRDDVEEYFTVKLGHVYPVWDVDFEKNLQMLLDYEKTVQNLIFNGRPGLFFYNNLHHSLDMGFVAADHVLSGKPKSQKWDVDSQRFREFHLVE